MKNLRKVFAFLIVASMLFTSNASFVLADANNETNNEVIDETFDENIEETTTKAIKDEVLLGAEAETEDETEIVEKDVVDEDFNEGFNEDYDEDYDEDFEDEEESTIFEPVADDEEIVDDFEYEEEPEEDATDYIEEPEEDPTIAEITESTEDESSAESFDEQETIENEQNPSGEGSETEETNIEEESEETLAVEKINDEKKDKLYGASPYTAYIYYLTYNSSDKKYEKIHTAIQSDADSFIDLINNSIDHIYNDTNVPSARLQNWYVMNPADPTTGDNDAYDHFNSGSTIGNSPEALRQQIMNWYSSPTENFHIGAGFDRCTFNYMYLNIGDFTKPEERSKTYGGTQEGWGSDILDTPLNMMKTSIGYVDGIKGWYVHNPANPNEPTEDYNPYYEGTADYNGFEDALKAAYDDWNSNTPVANNIYLGAIYDDPSASTTYKVTYNQNLPSGYAVSTSKTWYTDSTSTDLSGSPIVLSGSSDMTCEDTSGYVRTLQGWNTYSSGAGSSYSFGDSINTDAGFAGDTLTLYAMWSDPVAPTTGFMYWKVDGDDNNKTIHYYASPGTGRAAVVIGTNGVEHTSLGSSDREKIKYAVFEDNIAATNLKCCFENFKGLESITNLGKLNTSNVTSMRQMFNSAGVKELDLTNFDTSNVTDMYGMFSSCENLETIRVSDKFVVDKVSTSNGKFMFANCDKLEGEKGTKISDLSSPFGVAYAHIDEGSTNPGLFSGASTPPTPPTPPTPAKTIDNISVLSHNTNTITADGGATFLPAISQGETFDLNGMVLKVTYNDGSTSTVTYNSTTASQFTISDNGAKSPSTITIGYGGKQTTYDYYVQSNPDFYIYINDPASNKKVGFTYIQISAGMIEYIYDNLAGSNTTGFYEINATGLKDAWNKYNKNATSTMTKEQARATADTFGGSLSQDVFWGITYGNTNPGGNSSSGNKGGDSSSDSGEVSPTNGPMGDLTKNPEYQNKILINETNNIPQNEVIKNDELVRTLTSYPENANRNRSNAEDIHGNRGYGQWMRIPNTTTWFFYSGDITFNQGNSTQGFLANGWYNLNWDGVDKWYRFDNNGVMQLGWHQENGKLYFFQNDFSDNWYGKSVTGTQNIGGVVYHFDSTGALIQ